MADGLGITSLGDKISGIVSSNSGNDALATELAQGLARWFKENVFPLATGIAIFVTVLFIFYGSFLYFTAYGDENRATTAKKTLTYAIVGFAIAALAFSIASYSKRLIITKEYEDTHSNSGTGSAAQGSSTNDAPVQDPNQPMPDLNPYEVEPVTDSQQ